MSSGSGIPSDAILRRLPCRLARNDPLMILRCPGVPSARVPHDSPPVAAVSSACPRGPAHCSRLCCGTGRSGLSAPCWTQTRSRASQGGALPRGQGKSTLVAALGLYELMCGGEGATVIAHSVSSRRSSSSASATSIDGSGPPRSRAAWRRATTNCSSESMVWVSRPSYKRLAAGVWAGFRRCGR